MSERPGRPEGGPGDAIEFRGDKDIGGEDGEQVAGAVDRGAAGLKDDWDPGTRESVGEMGSGGQSESLESERSRGLAVVS